jgi:hypothetical protein
MSDSSDLIAGENGGVKNLTILTGQVGVCITSFGPVSVLNVSWEVMATKLSFCMVKLTTDVPFFETVNKKSSNCK